MGTYQPFSQYVHSFFSLFINDPRLWSALIAISILTFAACLYRLTIEVKNILEFQAARKKENERKVKDICLFHLKSVLESLLKLYPDGKTKQTQSLNITKEIFHEISAGLFVYYDVFLKHIQDLNVSNLSKTIDFFHAYQIEVKNLSTCMGEMTILGEEKSAKYYTLIAKLREAIRELT